MRDLIVSLFIIGSLPICFRRPFFGLLMFTLLAYMRVQDLTWGFARVQRWSYYVAIITIAGFLASRGERKFMDSNLRTWLMITLVVLVGASMLGSEYRSPRDFEIFLEYGKIIGVALFTTGVVRTRDHLRILMWVIALSFGFYGVKNGLAFILSGGGLVIIQGPGGMLSDNNDFALALCMGIPMLLHLALPEKSDLVRRATLAIIPLMVMTIIATHSRGAFLALSVTTLLLVWRSPNRVAGFALVLFLGLAGSLAVPKSFKDRIATIGSYEEDASARGRLEAWKVAGNMIVANPFLGVGYAKFQNNYKTYDPRALTVNEGSADQVGTRVAHNSYLQIWAESGTPAFLVYLVLLGSVFFACRKVLRMSEGRPDLAWAGYYARMMETTTVGFMVGAFFLNRGHFDLVYHWLALVSCLAMVAKSAWQQVPELAGARDRVRRITVRFARPWGVGQGAAVPSGTVATPRWR